jgi:hypothetical protein
MAKMTLLEIVQNILSAIDGDDVNSISDTTESLQVATIVQETFDEMFGGLSIPEHKRFIQLASLADPSRPNYLKMVDSIQSIQWVKYQDSDNENQMKEIKYLTPDDFIGILLSQGVNTDIPYTFNSTTGPVFPVLTDKTPTYYTSFDDVHLVFDSYNSAVDTTIQSSKTIVYGQIIPEFLQEDDFIPWIDSNLFPLLLAESKATAFINLKQVSSSKEEQRSRRQRFRWQNDTRKNNAAAINRLPDYGRHR